MKINQERVLHVSRLLDGHTFNSPSNEGIRQSEDRLQRGRRTYHRYLVSRVATGLMAAVSDILSRSGE